MVATERPLSRSLSARFDDEPMPGGLPNELGVLILMVQEMRGAARRSDRPRTGLSAASPPVVAAALPSRNRNGARLVRLQSRWQSRGARSRCEITPLERDLRMPWPCFGPHVCYASTVALPELPELRLRRPLPPPVRSVGRQCALIGIVFGRCYGAMLVCRDRTSAQGVLRTM